MAERPWALADLAAQSTEVLIAALSAAVHASLFKKNGQTLLEAEQLIAAIRRELRRRGVGLVQIALCAPWLATALGA